MVKIIQTSDIHIKNTTSHEIYRNVFEQFYKFIEQEQPDIVVIAGDIAHTKTNISPEFVELASNLFKNIADRCKLIITLGNHDLNLKSKHRQDAISPIVEALNHPNIYFQKYTGVIELNDVVFNVLSEIDRENWKHPEDIQKLNIAIYHGTIAGSKIDSGFSLEHGDEANVLYGNDYSFLGDIHCQQQVLKQGWEEKYIEESELQDYLQKGWEIDE